MRSSPNGSTITAIEKALAAGAEFDPEFIRTAFDQLRPTEKIFVKAFVATNSAVNAIKHAMPGVAPNVVNIRAHDMLRRPLVQAAIAQYVKDQTSKFDVTLERTLAEIAKIGYANISDMLKKDPTTGELEINETTGMPVGDLSKMTRDDLAAVAGFDVKELKDGGLIITPKMHSKNDALDKLMRYLGAYAPEKKQIDIRTQNLNINVDMSAEEAADMYSKSLEGEDE
jgi:phage terminase small subunit